MQNSQLSPRQKMINMLYLVLTAILALNVSSEVLDAFKNVNDGISTSNSSIQSKNSDIYADMGEQFKNDPLKAKQAYEKSKQARQVSAKLFALLEQYKKEMIADAGGIDPETGKIKRDDDINVPTHMFVENGGAKGKMLKQQIEATRVELLSLVPAESKAEIEKSLALKIDAPVAGNSWEFAKFNHVPVVAAVTLLTKYQNDLLGAESHVIETLYKSIDARMDKVDRMEAKIISPSSLILQGEAYKADVMVAAYSSTQHPDVFLGSFTSAVKKEGNTYQMIESASDVPPLSNARMVDVDGGFGKIAMDGSSTGVKKYTGVIRVKKDDKFRFYPFEGEYQVAPKMAVVAPKMMNVLYIGLDNALDVSVPGVAQSEVSAALTSNGALQKNADGSYVAKVTTPGEAKVIVKAKVNGKEMVMGEHKFRVKSVPSPVTTLDGVYEGGRISKAKIKSTRGVVPLLKNFDFNA
ncbi:MAG TPA: gliding motility protein GldM, partial [Chitinophagales bacterium]|nr:gliding motility protein GldM [Chitinophagales bacterium]